MQWLPLEKMEIDRSLTFCLSESKGIRVLSVPDSFGDRRSSFYFPAASEKIKCTEGQTPFLFPILRRW